MNSNQPISFAFAAALVAGTSVAAVAAGGTSAALASGATVTMAQARATALRTVHGTIAAAELEREKGGSGLRYSFDVKTPSGMREVGVDAKTGAVLENSSDGPATSGEKTESDGD